MNKIYENLMKRLAKLDADEDNLSKKLKTCKAEIELVKSSLLAVMQQENLEAVKGKYGRAWKHDISYPKVEDWEKVYAYITKHKAFDILHRRVSLTAYQERIDSGHAVPGIKLETGVKLEYRRK